MTIRKLLVPVTGGDTCRPALAAALTVARDFDAHVEALHVRPDPQEAVPLLGEGVSGAMIEDLINLTRSEAETRAHHARAMFEEACAAFGVEERADPSFAGPSAEWCDVVGREDDETVRRGRLADLVVAGHPASSADGPSGLTLNAALFEGGRPVLVAPLTELQMLGRRVAVAWNGSAEAARAVTAALPFLQRADAIVLYSVETPVTPGDAAAELAQFLRWHTIASTQTGNVPVTSKSAGEAILEACRADNIDLLVMGAYTHSRLREMILGGITRLMLEQAGVSLLMAH